MLKIRDRIVLGGATAGVSGGTCRMRSKLARKRCGRGFARGGLCRFLLPPGQGTTLGPGRLRGVDADDWMPADLSEWVLAVLKTSRRPVYQREQIIPGADPDGLADPIDAAAS